MSCPDLPVFQPASSAAFGVITVPASSLRHLQQTPARPGGDSFKAHHFLLPRNLRSAFSCPSTAFPAVPVSLLAPHKQPLPLSPPFSFPLPNAPAGDASDRAVAELLEAVARRWWCPHSSCRRSHCGCWEVWLPRVVPRAPRYPTATPGVSPGWAEQGSLFRVVAINSTTANISLRYWTVSSNQSLIAVSLSKTKSPKEQRKGIKRPKNFPLPIADGS